jgi:hypothetical protein
MLLAGNRRFVAGTPEHPNQDAARRSEVAPAQRPFAVVFGCSDSRLAAEIIFDRGLGDLFVVRTAGHVIGPEVLGSIEYGVSVLGCCLVVVLGHDSCGAVAAARAAVADGTTARGYVRDVIERVMPSVLTARAAGRIKRRRLHRRACTPHRRPAAGPLPYPLPSGRRRNNRGGRPVLPAGRRHHRTSHGRGVDLTASPTTPAQHSKQTSRLCWS